MSRNEPRMPDCDLADIIGISSVEMLRSIIADGEYQIAKLGRVELTIGSYRLNRAQCLYLVMAINTHLGKLAVAGVKEAFDTPALSNGPAGEAFSASHAFH